MKNNIRSKKTRFILVAVISAVFLAAALLIFTVQNNRRITGQNREYLLDHAGQIARSVDSAIADGYSNIKILSALAERSMTGPDFDIKSMQDLIKDSVFDFMEFADTEGMDHNITGGTSDATDRQYYLDAKDGNCGMELIPLSRATHETLLMFYAPIRHEGGFAGSLVGVYQASNRITKLLGSEYFGEKADTYLVTGEGLVIARDHDYDPNAAMHITDLAEGNDELIRILTPDPEQTQPVTFSLPGNATGGCMIRLPGCGYYLVQVFPQEASHRMTASANMTGYILIMILVLLYVCILIALIVFYRSQQRQVEVARNQAEVANQAKTSFLFNMSHDIRTPMNAITGFTDKAIRHINEPEIRDEALEKVKDSSAYLLRIINDILDMAKIESGKLELKEELYYAGTGGNTLLEVFGADAARKGIEFRTSYNIRDRYIWLDESRVNQIMANLISNAIKYTEPGGEIDYSVDQVPGARPGNGKYVIAVKDTGCGMNAEFLPRIFDAFERDPSAIRSGQQGTGLGMAIVKKLSEAMGGTVDITSVPGKGTTVRFTVEHRLATEEEIADYLSREPVLSHRQHSDFTGKRILLVEDNELNRDIAVDLLEEKGFKVDTAEDGSIAVEMLEEVAARQDYSYYMAVLMDVQMPVMNGYDATRRIRQIPVPEGVHLPIIAMTANAFEEDRKNALDAGMDDHVAKPVDVRKLFETLSKFF